MSRTDKKQTAQSELMSAMQVAFDRFAAQGADAETVKIASREMARVEKLFGFVPYSFGRGS